MPILGVSVKSLSENFDPTIAKAGVVDMKVRDMNHKLEQMKTDTDNKLAEMESRIVAFLDNNFPTS